ncbi:leaf rust 10 disease-resistance locus receptor-like protein kinase-like 2.4 protein [Tanacetum coccineum]
MGMFIQDSVASLIFRFLSFTEFTLITLIIFAGCGSSWPGNPFPSVVRPLSGDLISPTLVPSSTASSVGYSHLCSDLSPDDNHSTGRCFLISGDLTWDGESGDAIVFRIQGSYAKQEVEVGFSCGTAGIVLLLLVIKLRLWDTRKSADYQIEKFVSNYRNMVPKRYKYSEIKKMTKSFLEKLGQGGYGSVYKGELPDGNLVAVKLLREATEDREDFINEVASIGRTSHVNIVTLLGFCIEERKEPSCMNSCQMDPWISFYKMMSLIWTGIHYSYESQSHRGGI